VLAGLVSGGVLLGAFAVMMLAASVSMIRGRRDNGGPREESHLLPAVALGIAVGTATGFVGAGGGFVIVPALVLMAGLPMPAAVGTSLLVIAMQSAAGLAGHLHNIQLPWGVTLAATTSAVVGSLLGSRFTGRIPAETLRKGFGLGVLAVAVLVLIEQLPHSTTSRALLWTAVALAAALLTVAMAPTSGPGSSRQETPMPATPRSTRPSDTSSTISTSDSSSTISSSTMIFTQHYIDCLSQASYLIGDTSTGQAVIVDPRRDVREYLDDAAAAGLRIVGMINTHFHADFLSGHLELTKATGAWIGYGQVAKAEFEIRPLADGERIPLGNVVLEIIRRPDIPRSRSAFWSMSTPTTRLPTGTDRRRPVHRRCRSPDLLASIGVTADTLGRQLYHTIQHKLMGLPDQVRVFPGHGAGSACGKSLSTERQSTIGQQRALNYACQPMTEDEFLALVTAGQPSAPEYFVYDAILNRQQREVFDAAKPLPAVDNPTLDAALARGAVVLDTRSTPDFAAGHLPGALNVPADGRFAETAGMVLTSTQEIVIIAPEGRQTEVAVRLARIGFDQVAGFVADPEAALVSRADRVQRASRLTAVQLADLMTGTADPPPLVLDVRDLSSATPATSRLDPHPLAELRRRWRGLSVPRSSRTAPAGGAPAPRPACFAKPATMTCRTCSAVSPLGKLGTNSSPREHLLCPGLRDRPAPGLAGILSGPEFWRRWRGVAETAPRPLDRHSPMPLWAQLRDDLNRRLALGAFDTAFPGEMDLVEAYAVSRHTVREALRRLREAGVLESARGRATRVRRDIEQPLGSLYSLFREVEARGMRQTSQVLALRREHSPDAAAALGVWARTPLIYLERVRLADDEPLAHDQVWLPADLAAPLLEADFTHAALYDEFADRCGVRLTGGREHITARIPSPVVRSLLRLPVDQACLRVERTGTVGDRTIEHRVTMVRGDRYAVIADWSAKGYTLGNRG
jgi:DNA-binding GntR family transcriptional regulator/glyoxylase-like metal-dependent hydrolase (beta-lactamase superfamily II)/rhodanese-related sulfurtransferase